MRNMARIQMDYYEKLLDPRNRVGSDPLSVHKLTNQIGHDVTKFAIILFVECAITAGVRLFLS